MDNFKEPAYPTFPIDGYGSSLHGSNPNGTTAWCSNPGGFTKLELASLMIAQGMSANSKLEYNDPYKDIPEQAVKLAKSVLEQANK